MARLAACFVDHRAAAQVEHTLAAIVAQRVFGLALGGSVDHYHLRRDPVLATLPGKLEAKRATPPHDHTTWAVVVGIEGEEVNRLWRRVDDGAAPGKAELEQVEETLVAPGTGVALMPDNIHGIHRASDAPLLHFHLYGRSIERLPERKQFDLQRGTYQVYPANPNIQR